MLQWLRDWGAPMLQPRVPTGAFPAAATGAPPPSLGGGGGWEETGKIAHILRRLEGKQVIRNLTEWRHKMSAGPGPFK